MNKMQSFKWLFDKMMFSEEETCSKGQKVVILIWG